MQRGRDRLRGAGERALLRVAQHALELAHVLDAEPRQREEHREHEQELRADAERESHALRALMARSPARLAQRSALHR